MSNLMEVVQRLEGRQTLTLPVAERFKKAGWGSQSPRPTDSIRYTPEEIISKEAYPLGIKDLFLTRDGEVVRSFYGIRRIPWGKKIPWKWFYSVEDFTFYAAVTPSKKVLEFIKNFR